MEKQELSLDQMPITGTANGIAVSLYTATRFVRNGMVADALGFSYGFKYNELEYPANCYMSSVTVPEPRIANFLAYFYVPPLTNIYFSFRFYYRDGQLNAIGLTEKSPLYVFSVPENANGDVEIKLAFPWGGTTPEGDYLNQLLLDPTERQRNSEILTRNLGILNERG